jgi:hypothetical protein
MLGKPVSLRLWGNQHYSGLQLQVLGFNLRAFVGLLGSRYVSASGRILFSDKILAQ